MVKGSYLPSRETLLVAYKNLHLHIRINCKRIIRSYWEKVGNPYDCSFMINGDIFMSYVVDIAPKLIKAYEELSKKTQKKTKFIKKTRF